ncbi:hypothetical protein [Sphingopyxis sp.]|uniref:hypothetical protein n=1 Tax=Sphingopyxis sp. TaxID=1908224 RepID=UPI003D6C9C00
MANDDYPEKFGTGGDIDPMTADVGGRRRRVARDRPAPPDELRKWEAKAEQRMLARPYPPNVILEPAGMDREHLTSPHSDPALWTLQLADAFGTRSRAVIDFFMSQLREFCGGNIWDEEAQQWRLDETEYSAMLALVNAHRPKNEAQAMIAAQLVGLHILSMKVTARGIRYPYETRTVTNAAKLATATANLTDAMQGLKGRNRTARQSIKVTKETHYHAHRHDPPTPGGGAGNSERPHERKDSHAAQIDDQRTLVRREESSRVALSLPSDEG